MICGDITSVLLVVQNRSDFNILYFFANGLKSAFAYVCY